MEEVSSALKLKGQKLKWKVRQSLNSLKLWDRLEFARLLGRLVLRQPHDQDLAFFANFNSEDSVFLDIGANIGQTVVSLRIFNRSARIISFEPNPLLAPQLKLLSSFVRNFEFHTVGIGEVNESKTLYIPFVGQTPFTQEASFKREVIENDPLTQGRIKMFAGDAKIELRSVEMKIRRLDDFELSPDFIKLDVQGYELSALKGAEATISRSRPLLIIENCHAIFEIEEHLKKCGYSASLFYSPGENKLMRVVDPHGQMNVFFIPLDKEKSLRERGLLG